MDAVTAWMPALIATAVGAGVLLLVSGMASTVQRRMEGAYTLPPSRVGRSAAAKAAAVDQAQERAREVERYRRIKVLARLVAAVVTAALVSAIIATLVPGWVALCVVGAFTVVLAVFCVREARTVRARRASIALGGRA